MTSDTSISPKCDRRRFRVDSFLIGHFAVRVYTLRMQGHADGEVGTLFEAFNKMLDQIQHSKDELARANDELEERVPR